MSKLVALIDYGSGNLRSAEKALERASLEGATGHRIVVTDDPAIVAGAERIVLPGVGAFADCMRGLLGVPGMAEMLKQTVVDRGVPFLGICVGMQLMADFGREFQDTEGLGWIEGEVRTLVCGDPRLKIPHMGWNELILTRPHPLFAGVEPGAHVYFVHSFAVSTRNADDVLATADYGGPVVAAVGRDNLVGTQFHPEKSQVAGVRILSNFLSWRP
jgi:glutamine amidotransferase